MTISPHNDYSTQKLFEKTTDEFLIGRFPTARDFVENIEFIFDVLRDDVERFLLRTGKNTNRFYDAFNASVRMTVRSLSKKELTGTCRFMQLSGAVALRWLKSRLLNNVITAMSNPKSLDYIGHFDREDWENVSFGNADIEVELAGLTREQIVDGLKKLFLDGADVGELEYLADRFGIDLSDAIGVYTTPVVVERSPDGSPQLAFDF